MTRTYYQLLGLSPDASAEQIKAKYKELALESHPDKVLDPTLKKEANRRFQQISEAYSVLSDPYQRGRYDARLEQQTDLPPPFFDLASAFDVFKSTFWTDPFSFSRPFTPLFSFPKMRMPKFDSTSQNSYYSVTRRYPDSDGRMIEKQTIKRSVDGKQESFRRTTQIDADGHRITLSEDGDSELTGGYHPLPDLPKPKKKKYRLTE